MDVQNSNALLLNEEGVKRLVPQRFDGCRCHRAYPDQLHTFVGDCSSATQVVALVPNGDVEFQSNTINGDNLIAVIGEEVSADYLEFLEDLQISYIFAGRNGNDENVMKVQLSHDFGIENLIDYNKGKAA